MFDIFRTDINLEKYFVVQYHLKSSVSLRDAAWNLALGQAIGNSTKRSYYETDSMFEKHSCLILHSEKELENKLEGLVNIAFPLVNINFKTDGISALISLIQGGNLDFSTMLESKVKNINFPDSVKKDFLGPKFGITGIRKKLNAYNKPIVGGILKPKIGMDSKILLEMTKVLVENGIQWIKEDECLLGDSLPLEERVPVIVNYLKDKNVIYHFNITADPIEAIERVKLVHKLGGNGIHINIHAGLGIYKAIRSLDLPLFLHFQKSGDKLYTNKDHAFNIDWKVVSKLAAISGVDTAHSTMYGGYMNESEEEVKAILKTYRNENSLPAMSCGMTPPMVSILAEKFGNDLLLNSGGGIWSNKQGPESGVRAFVQAANGQLTHKDYLDACEQYEIKP